VRPSVRPSVLRQYRSTEGQGHSFAGGMLPVPDRKSKSKG
jgi:hypothetical protein